MDISNPINPLIIFQNKSVTIKRLFVHNNYLFTAGYDDDVLVYDISDPENPSFTTSYDYSSIVTDLYILDNYLYTIDFSRIKKIIYFAIVQTLYSNLHYPF